MPRCRLLENTTTAEMSILFYFASRTWQKQLPKLCLKFVSWTFLLVYIFKCLNCIRVPVEMSIGPSHNWAVNQPKTKRGTAIQFTMKWSSSLPSLLTAPAETTLEYLATTRGDSASWASSVANWSTGVATLMHATCAESNCSNNGWLMSSAFNFSPSPIPVPIVLSNSDSWFVSSSE